MAVHGTQGQELESLRRDLGYQRIVYCGDGANDLCPALALTPSDVLLARAGHQLAALVEQRTKGDLDAAQHGGPVVAQVRLLCAAVCCVRLLLLN